MKRAPCIAAAAALALASCKGEQFAVDPCLTGGTLGFEVGTLPAWFGLARVHPRISEISVMSAGVTVWATDSESIDLHATKRRSFILYGEQFADMQTKAAAQPLQKGIQYRVMMRFGGHDGQADFVFDNSLRNCTRT